MAQQLTQVMTQSRDFATQAMDQIFQENLADPLSGTSHKKVFELTEGVAKVRERLRIESKLFSPEADLSAYVDEELSMMLPDVRESSRKLAVVLAAGGRGRCGSSRSRSRSRSNSRRSRSFNTTAHILQSVASYLDPAVAKDLNSTELVKFLSLTSHEPVGRKEQEKRYDRSRSRSCSTGSSEGVHIRGKRGQQRVTREELSIHLKERFSPGSTGAASLRKLATQLQSISEQLAQAANAREEETVEAARVKQEGKRL